MTNIDEGNNTLDHWIEVLPPKEPVLESNSSGLIHHSQAVDACDLTRIEQGLPLNIRTVGGNSEDQVIRVYFIDLVEPL